MSKVEITDGCWYWTGAKRSTGYGNFCFNGVSTGAHRVSWFIFKGNIKNNLFVLHKCDNPSCVNPEHLFLGTQKDNIEDMHRKGRNQKLYNATHASDENHQVSILTNEDVRFIRSSNLSLKEIRKKLNNKVKLLAIQRAKEKITFREVQ